MRKKLFALFIALIMVLGMVPTGLFAAGTNEYTLQAEAGQEANAEAQYPAYDGPSGDYGYYTNSNGYPNYGTDYNYDRTYEGGEPAPGYGAGEDAQEEEDAAEEDEESALAVQAFAGEVVSLSAAYATIGNDWYALELAVSTAPNGAIIELTEAVVMSGAPQARTLEAVGRNVTLQVTGSFRHFIVAGTHTLTIGEGIILQGHRPASLPTLTANCSTPYETDLTVDIWPIGGGVQVMSNSHFILDGGIIRGNRAPNEGGGVMVGSGSTFTLESGTITDNMANARAGVEVFGSDVHIRGGEISNNIALLNGGGVGISGGASGYMQGGEIRNNRAISGGGGGLIILNPNANFTVYEGRITENRAVNGGGIHIGNGTDAVQPAVNPILHIQQGVVIERNIAEGVSGRGGGLDAINFSTIIVDDGVEFNNNTAPRGDAIHIRHNNNTMPFYVPSVNYTIGSSAISGSVSVESYSAPPSDMGWVVETIFFPSGDGIRTTRAGNIARDENGAFIVTFLDGGAGTVTLLPSGETTTVPGGSTATLPGSNGPGSVDVNLPSPLGSLTVPEGVSIAIDESCAICQGTAIVITVPAGASGEVILPNNGGTRYIPVYTAVRTIRICEDGRVTITPPLPEPGHPWTTPWRSALVARNVLRNIWGVTALDGMPGLLRDHNVTGVDMPRVLFDLVYAEQPTWEAWFMDNAVWNPEATIQAFPFNAAASARLASNHAWNDVNRIEDLAHFFEYVGPIIERAVELSEETGRVNFLARINSGIETVVIGLEVDGRNWNQVANSLDYYFTTVVRDVLSPPAVDIVINVAASGSFTVAPAATNYTWAVVGGNLVITLIGEHDATYRVDLPNAEWSYSSAEDSTNLVVTVVPPDGFRFEDPRDPDDPCDDPCDCDPIIRPATDIIINVAADGSFTVAPAATEYTWAILDRLDASNNVVGQNLVIRLAGEYAATYRVDLPTAAWSYSSAVVGTDLVVTVVAPNGFEFDTTGRWTLLDALRIDQWLIDRFLVELGFAPHYNVTIDEAVKNVSGTGTVSALDSLMIRQYIVDWGLIAAGLSPQYGVVLGPR